MAFITGVGQTEFSRDSKRSVQRLAVEAALTAIADADLRVDDVDGVVPFPVGPCAEDLIAGLGISDCRFSAVPHMGGASSVAALRLACLAVDTGLAKNVLIFVARNGRSEGRVDQRVGVAMPGQHFRKFLEHPHGLNVPAQWYSLICRRHMIEFGTTREHLAHVALSLRENALHNPGAMMYGRSLTIDDYMAAPFISAPYSLYDCCLETDGASAVIVSGADHARDSGHPIISVAGSAEGHADSADDIANRRDFFNIGLTKAAPRAFSMAGIGPSDVDLALIYDCFTFEVIQQLEEAGFCARGEGGDFIKDIGIGLGGGLPVNPNGGLLSEGHIGGMNNMVEAVSQLRGGCGERQIADAEVAVVTGWGDLGDGAMAVLCRL